MKDNLQKDGRLEEQRRTGSEIDISPPPRWHIVCFPLGWKNTLHLKLRHILALSHLETNRSETTLELGIVNLLRVVV